MFLKKLKEKRVELKAQMDSLISMAEAEERAMSEEESGKFDEYEKEISKIDKTIEAYEKRAAEEMEPEEEDEEEGKDEEAEERAFVDYIRGTYVEERADTNLTFTDNGAVIPSSIANKIIDKVKDICPIFMLADTYNVGGTLTIPKYDESTQKITMAYQSEFSELESTSGKFTSIELKGFLAGVLTKVSKQLINNSNFDILSYIVNKMAEAIVAWLEKELLIGTQDKIQGLSGVTQVVTTAAAAAITADELIDLQEEIPDVYKPASIWIMNRATRKAIRKLKDAEGNYLLNKDMTARWGYTLLGSDVYCSDQMPEIAAGETAIYYGDMSGLALKISEAPSVEILREKFATQHAVGVVGWLEVDAKVEDEQKIAALKMKAGA